MTLWKFRFLKLATLCSASFEMSLVS